MKKFILGLVALLLLLFVSEDSFAQGHVGCCNRIYNVYPYTYYYYPYVVYPQIMYQPYMVYYPVTYQQIYYPYYYYQLPRY